MGEAPNFTPGPWAIREATFGGEFEVYPMRPGESLMGFGSWAEIATVNEGGDDEPAEANARLIAAAPDMFAALQEVADCAVLIGSGEEAVSAAAMASVRSAIAKVLASPTSEGSSHV